MSCRRRPLLPWSIPLQRCGLRCIQPPTHRRCSPAASHAEAVSAAAGRARLCVCRQNDKIRELWVLKLHSGLPPAEQKKVFDVSPVQGLRKVVLSTNMAESRCVPPTGVPWDVAGWTCVPHNRQAPTKGVYLGKSGFRLRGERVSIEPPKLGAGAGAGGLGKRLN